MKHLAKVNSKGQITIPQEVMQRLGLKQGDRVSFEVENGSAVLRLYRSADNPFKAFEGALGDFETKDDINAWLSELRD